MTFSSRTVNVRCLMCKQALMEVHVDNKIYGPYQKIAHTKRGNEREDGWLDRETIFYHHDVDNDKGCNCFADKIELEKNRYTFYNVFSREYSNGSIKEDEKITCRIIWHEVYGFSDAELENRFEFVCCHCKRKGDLKSFESFFNL